MPQTGPALAAAAGPDERKRWVVRLPTVSSSDRLHSQVLADELASSLEEFWVDKRALLHDLEITVRRGYIELAVEDRTDDEVIQIVERLIRLLGHPKRSELRPAWRSPWAIAALLIAVASVGLSLLPLSTASLVILGTSTAAIAVVTIGYASRQEGDGVGVLLKLAPILLMIAFALIYGAAATGDDCTVATPVTSASTTTAAAEPPCEVLSPDTEAHLRDPLVLSLQAMVTGGFGDIAAYGWTRSVVYIEMLLLWGGVAIAVVAVGRRFERIDAALKREQDHSPPESLE